MPFNGETLSARASWKEELVYLHTFCFQTLPHHTVATDVEGSFARGHHLDQDSCQDVKKVPPHFEH